jgi:hypothetical protein
MAKRDSRSGEPPQSSQSAFDFKIHVLGPVAGGTPWWARRAKLRYTHMVIQVDNYIWDQPIRGIGKLYHASEWLTHALASTR